MRIHHLHLHHFRNHTETSLQVDGNCVVITGPNGAGKTNILEAISLFSPGKGMRHATLRSMTHHAQSIGGWVVSAQCKTPHDFVQLGTGLDVSAKIDKRLVRADGEKLKSQSELTAYLSVLWQTPQMDGLFLAGASERRRFLDRLVYGFDEAHAGHVAAYEHAMRERNRLLKDQVNDTVWLDTLEHKMASSASVIADARAQMVARLNATMQTSTTGFPKAHITLVEENEDSQEHWQQLFASRRAIDARTGRATRGVHRVEVQVVHHLKNMPAALCSTGEQKALLLAILLAHARSKREHTGTAPILLLDEVVAHLDVVRRRELFAEIQELGVQAWLTGTDTVDFDGLKPFFRHFQVQDGQAIESTV